MAPEQARGEHVDQRADVYTFGLIVYDMLVGSTARRACAVSPGDELKGGSYTPPPSVRSVVPAAAWSRSTQLVTKCVEPEVEEALPDDRRTSLLLSIASMTTAS